MAWRIAAYTCGIIFVMMFVGFTVAIVLNGPAAFLRIEPIDFQVTGSIKGGALLIHSWPGMILLPAASMVFGVIAFTRRAMGRSFGMPLAIHGVLALIFVLVMTASGAYLWQAGPIFTGSRVVSYERDAVIGPLIFGAILCLPLAIGFMGSRLSRRP